ncbi:AAA family ATPase [Deinococcus peraridilitoris]|uniref:MoxR-like ATPase n=1 Tax=Deinococcus peraridilitoris (strain DSM 19664 / LMG 22246 / CIP 109416 / KR-200) TaxID=937777 RepID=K9ZY21_DEIPD|nr:MoxR family ATPase [Deinococcus peraridilitoris]AFZ66563.1 MoxR-like ATPase [Deinococcus peraridilitoris DSM 19664]
MANPTASSSAALAQQALSQLENVILGKPRQLRLALTCLLARGHLLIEDLPGVGKTSLAHALAGTLGLEFARVQFTSDLLPSDLIGVSVFEQDTQRFHFHPGPIFTQLLLADEINRATPKTQSALLEAMEERQVSIERETRALPEPFFVIGTQNPADQLGTFKLPESQLDRFLMVLSLGYPDAVAERALLQGGSRRDQSKTLPAVLSLSALQAAQDEVSRVYVSGALLDYVQLLLKATRESPVFRTGLSPRAALGLMAAARGWAWLDGRDLVLPEDVQAVFPAVAAHRLPLRTSGAPDRPSVLALLAATRIP